MLGRSAKLQWSLGHKSLKTIYEGALIPLLTYGAPVWDEAAVKQRNLRMLQRVQRMINMESAKAHRTISFEASCMKAGVPHTIEEKARLHKIKHNAERSEYEYDIPLPIKEWTHPARRLNIMEICDSTPYCTEIYRRKQNRRQSRSRSGHICGPSAETTAQTQAQNCRSNSQAEQIAILKSL